MLARLSGILESVDGAGAVVGVAQAGSAYEVMLSAHGATELAPRVGQRVELRTFQYLEQQAQGASFIPRLVGFTSEADQRLFELLTRVKGLGVKRALRAMAAPAHQIAAAIVEGDIGFLKSLPEIGKKLAETVVLELKDRVGALALDAPASGIVESRPGVSRETAVSRSGSVGAVLAGAAAQQAVAALERLGEDRDRAESRVRAFLKEAGDGVGGMSADEILSGSFSVRL